jgi:hypothetical protein
LQQNKKHLPCHFSGKVFGSDEWDIVLFFEFSTLKLSYLEAMTSKLHGKFCETSD